MSMTPEEKRAKKAEYDRRYREANKERLSKYLCHYKEANKQKQTENARRYYYSNKEKIAEKDRLYLQANKNKIAERKREKYKSNKNELRERNRRSRRKAGFAKESGLSFQSWMASLNKPGWTFEAIANLNPDEGQTLAELIHELSGYAMEVCEQIANPPIEAKPEALTPAPAADLF